jgi:hypothetical protein
MGCVRKLQPNDIPRVVDLNNKLFPSSVLIRREDQVKLFETVCFDNPWFDEEITSLVYEDEHGELRGFLGVLARPMVMNGERLRAAVFQHLMVDRSTLASFQMFRALLDGPQDVSMGENAVEVVHQLWNRLGHPVSRLNSIYWRRFLRPASAAALQLKKRPKTRRLGEASWPICRGIDAVLARIPKNPLRVPPAFTPEDDELDECTMLEHLPRMMERSVLRPEYAPDTLHWLMQVLEREDRNGRLQKKIVRNERGGIAGWYLYYLNPAGPSVVFQTAGTEKTIGAVLDHLFSHAAAHGAVELTGRIEPRYMKALFEKKCFFMPGRNWMLLHSRRSEILHAIDRGDAFLSRLEGDLWVL